MSPRGVAGYLNGLPPEAAVRELLRCCGSERWARGLIAGGPYASDEELFEAAERLWWNLDLHDWREAFAAHPRIGERRGGDWSATEQSGMGEASRALRVRIREGNARYEARFGHVFLICATGLTARQMAAALERRLAADPDDELRTAAAEQAKITRLRLEKLVTT